MPYESFQNSVITTSSGVVGGVTKAIASGFTLNSISIMQMLDVSIYAAVSAIVGYTVKYIIDSIRKRRKERRSR